MTFFYDLNKKLDEIRATPSTTHSQLNERDMGKHNNGKTTGFKAVADKAAKEYGSKAAGERVAGAQFQKMKKAGQLEEEGMSRAAKGYEKYGKQGMEALAKAGREGKALDPVRKKYDKYDNEVDEGMGDAVKKVGSMAKKVGGAVLNRLGHGSDEDMRKDLQRKMGMPQTGKKPEQVKEKMSPAKAQSFAALAPPKDKITFADKIAGAKKEVDEMLGDVAAEAMRGALSGGQKKLDKNKNGKLDAMDFEMLRKGVKEDDKEDLNPFTNYKKPRKDAPRVGDVEHGSKHDIKHTSTGRMVTRRTDDQGISVGSETDSEGNTIEKRGRGRPKGPEKAPERVTSKATKHKGGRKTNEGDLEIADRGEYDQEGDMAKDSIKTVVRHAQALEKILGDNDNLPEWVQSKLAKIESMMTAVDDYMQNQEEDDEEMAVGEEKTSTRDNHAERAGRKVTKDIEYDEKKKDGIHGKKRGAEDAKAEKAGKKVAKDIEYDEKKKKVKEQGGADTPTASSGFSFGQGIYDSMNHELETMIRESMNISMNMNTDANGGPSKSITVTASDDDAMKLGELLKNAGLGGDHDMGNTAEVEVHGAEDIADKIRQAMGDQGHGDGESCSACGQADCGCEPVDEAYGDDVVSQNSPDFPSNTETNDDALQYSDGLNRPKSTGQTTIPVIASQDSRQKGYGDGFDEDSLARLREMAGMRQDNRLDEGMMDKIKGMLVPKLMKLLGPDAEQIASAVKQATGGDLTPSKENAMKVVQALGLDKAAEQGQSPQMAEGIAGNWQGKLIQALYTLGLLGSAGAAASMWHSVGGSWFTTVGVLLLMFAGAVFGNEPGQVGAMGNFGNKGTSSQRGLDIHGMPVRNMNVDEDDLSRMMEMAGIKEGKKPDFPDIDNDGDKKETIEKALDDKKAAGNKKVAESLMAELQRYKKA